MDARARADIRLAEAVEAAACVDMYAAAPPAQDLHVAHAGGATLLVAPRIPATYFNRAIGLGDGAEPAAAVDIGRIRAIYEHAGVADYWIHLTPAALPAALPGWLADAGFAVHARRSWAKFLRGPHAPPDARTALLIRTAGAQDREAVAHIACTGFGMPPSLGPWFGSLVGRPGWQFFLACDDRLPVATGAVFVRGHTAWIGIGATLSAYRGRGAQGALLAARIRAAAAAGCTALVTETGEPVGDEHNPSLANIRRYGFIQVCSRLNFAAAPRPHG